MDRVGATVVTQAVATNTTSPAPGTLTAPTSSELAFSGRNIPPSFHFIVSDSNDDSNGVPQLPSDEETTPPASSDLPPAPKTALKRKLKKKAKKVKGEGKATTKAPKIKREKKADITKSSAKAGKLLVKLPLNQQQLPFSQQLQALDAKQAKQSTTTETTHRADDSSSDIQGNGDSTHPSSSGNKATVQMLKPFVL